MTFQPGVNTVLGENGSGKSNAFRAIRLLLDANLLASAYRIREDDFHRGLEDWRGHWIIISIEFSNVSADEAIQALFVHGVGKISDELVENATYNLIYRPNIDVRKRLADLAEGDHAGLESVLSTVTSADYETVFTGRSSANFNDPDTYTSLVGDFERVNFPSELDIEQVGAQLPRQLSIAKEISFTFIQALRDVVNDFQNNRANPLRSLLKHKSGEVDASAFAVVTEQVRKLNEKIEDWPDVVEFRDDVSQTLTDTVGAIYSPSSLSIKSELPDDADRLFQSLKLFLGEHGEEYEGAIHELSLGGANLIFLTLKLLEFKYQAANQSVANFLLIEEPEAHVHTHVQRTLFDRINYDDTQVIYSTHSTQISEVSNVRSMNILARDGGYCEAYQPSAGLPDPIVTKIERYLDAIRSNLLFAKSVILVEGDAEEMLLPVLFRKVLGVGLDQLGISLINIRSTGFTNVATLFHDDRIKKRCAIITDLDKATVPTEPVEGDTPAMKKYRAKAERSQKAGLERKQLLEGFVADNSWLACSFAEHTFEVDLIKSGNSDLFVDAITDVYTDQTTITKAKKSLESGELSKYGPRVLAMAKHCGKGWFALLIGGYVDHQTIIPAYILEALRFARPELDRETVHSILAYRLSMGGASGTYSVETKDRFRTLLQNFRKGGITFDEMREHTKTHLAGDRIIDVLEAY